MGSDRSAREPEDMEAAKKNEARKRARAIYALLKKDYPDAHCELHYSNPLELLVATILSAQCTDVRVNIVTKDLFREFRTPKDYLACSQPDLEQFIRSTGFFRNKAKNIRSCMKAILERHQGEVPRTMEELSALPGVGRKTANVVLGNAFGLPGLPVDTHVGRIAQRLGLTEESDPVKIEYDLHEVLPPKDWCQFSHTMIFHGRRCCKARNPLCGKCSLKNYCQYLEKNQ